MNPATGVNELRLEHFLCYSDAPSVDEHAAGYRRLGFVPQAHAARWAPGLRTRFVGLWPEYLELVWVEDEDAFAAASEDPMTRFRAARRPFGMGILSDDVSALHDEWVARGYELPAVRYESPAGSDPAAGPLFAFQAIPHDVLPGVDAFALTSYYRPVPRTRRQVWVAPNSVFGLAGITLVSHTPAEDADTWRRLLAPVAVVNEEPGGSRLQVGPHRLNWLTPEAYAARYGLVWTPSGDGADALALFELLAIDVEQVQQHAADAERPWRRLADGGLLLEPSAYDGFRFVVRQGDVREWARSRGECLGLDHEVVRVDELMARGRPGDGEYVLRPATLQDLPAIRGIGEQVLPETYAPILPDGYPDMLLERYWSDAANVAAIESPDEQLLVAESAVSGVVGVAHTAPYDDGRVILWRLYLLPRARGLGIGTALLDECIRRCPPEVTTFMTEYVAGNLGAATFYGEHGFAETGRTSEPWQETEIEVVYAARAAATDLRSDPS